MSDGFDKEAEREKLREKFADDARKREHTQRMSELLLKGATMTNRHCEACGDPIFRHDGREFCPTCGDGTAGGSETGGESQAAADAAVEAEGDATDAAATGGTADAAATGGVDPAENSSNGVDAAVAGGESGSTSPAAGSSRRSEPQRSRSPQRQGSRRPDSRRPESGRAVPRQSADDAGGIDAARASLTRTLTRFARAAEEADDPRRARDRLAAAREAAEALAALD